MPHKNGAEDALNQVATTAGVTTSSFYIFGIPLSEWVVVGTAVLVVCNLILTLPKVYRYISTFFKKDDDNAAERPIGPERIRTL